MFIAGFDGVAFVVGFLSSGEGDGDFGFAIFEVDFEGDDREALFFGLTAKEFDLLFVHQ